MSSSYVCQSCRHYLQRSLFHQNALRLTVPSSSPRIALRSISTTTRRHAAQPQPYQKNTQRATIGSTPPVDSDGSFDLPDTSSFNPARTIAKQLRKRARATTETYIAYGSCERLVKECARHAQYTIPRYKQTNVELPKTKDGEDLGEGTGWWYDVLGLRPTFNTWAQVTFLHMYLLTVRLRMFPAEYAGPWHQHLIDHFFFMAERRMDEQHGIVSATMRSRYLKDFFVQWRGLIAGYDEGLIEGDAVLAAAVWRNLFKADPDVDFDGLGQIVNYIRRVLVDLEKISDEDIASGQIIFSDPGEEQSVASLFTKVEEGAREGEKAASVS